MGGGALKRPKKQKNKITTKIGFKLVPKSVFNGDHDVYKRQVYMQTLKLSRNVSDSLMQFLKTINTYEFNTMQKYFM